MKQPSVSKASLNLRKQTKTRRAYKNARGSLYAERSPEALFGGNRCLLSLKKNEEGMAIPIYSPIIGGRDKSTMSLRKPVLPSKNLSQ